MDRNPLQAVSLRVFANKLIMNRRTLSSLFESAFAAHERRNILFADEVLGIDNTKELNAEQAEWMQLVGGEMMNENVARTVYAGTVISVHNGILQRFSAGLGMPNGERLRVGPIIRGMPMSHVLWATRNMVQHHDEWERRGEEYLRATYPETHEILGRISRGGGIMAVDAFDALVRLTEPEKTYTTLEQKLFACAAELVKEKWAD